MTLPNDTNRCQGRIASAAIPGPIAITTSVGQAECVRCQRRTAGPSTSPQGTWWMDPPPFVDGHCPKRIAP